VIVQHCSHDWRDEIFALSIRRIVGEVQPNTRQMAKRPPLRQHILPKLPGRARLSVTAGHSNNCNRIHEGGLRSCANSSRNFRGNLSQDKAAFPEQTGNNSSEVVLQPDRKGYWFHVNWLA